MDVTVTPVSLPQDPVILSVKAKDTTRQYHLTRDSRTLHFPWSLSGELKLQLLTEACPSQSLVLDRYLELGCQEDRLEIGGAVLSVAVLPSAAKPQDLTKQSGASERDRDRKYLDDTGLADVLSAALSRIIKERPDKPLEFLISDLQKSMT